MLSEANRNADRALGQGRQSNCPTGVLSVCLHIYKQRKWNSKAWFCPGLSDCSPCIHSCRQRALHLRFQSFLIKKPPGSQVVQRDSVINISAEPGLRRAGAAPWLPKGTEKFLGWAQRMGTRRSKLRSRVNADKHRAELRDIVSQGIFPKGPFQPQLPVRYAQNLKDSVSHDNQMAADAVTQHCL